MRIKLLLATLLLVLALPTPTVLARQALEIRADEIPKTYTMSAAYPNPFNPQTTFSFGVTEAQEVTIEVYNLLGRRVAELFKGPMKANKSYKLTFEAAGMQNGLYLIRAAGSDFVATQRVTLLK